MTSICKQTPPIDYTYTSENMDCLSSKMLFYYYFMSYFIHSYIYIYIYINTILVSEVIPCETIEDKTKYEEEFRAYIEYI